MKKRVLLINGHPDANPARLCHALADAYAKGATGAGHDVKQLNIATLSFPILRDPQEFMQPPANPDLLAAQDAFLWSEHIVFVFPLWMGGPPALLKAFMEGLGCGEFLLGQGKGGFPKGRLAGRTARIVVTMGMPSLIYRFYFRALGTRAFENGILRMAGIRSVRTTLIGGIGASVDRCRRWVGVLRDLGAKAG